MQDDQQVSEDRLRAALARLGTGSVNQERGNHDRGRPEKARPDKTPRQATPTPERRRRFVRDGQVVVEHASRSVGARNAHGGAHNGGPHGGVHHAAHYAESQEEVERLTQAVRREQRRGEEAERLLSETRAQLRSFETREAHAKIRIDELTRDLRQCREEMAALRVALHEAQEAAHAHERAPREPARRVERAAPSSGRTRRAAPPRQLALDAEEPVQWWVKN